MSDEPQPDRKPTAKELAERVKLEGAHDWDPDEAVSRLLGYKPRQPVSNT